MDSQLVFRYWLDKVTRNMVDSLHNVAITHGCNFKEVAGEQPESFVLVYSARGFRINVNCGTVSIAGNYDIRSFMRLYDTTQNDTVKELLFNAATPCEYCIHDKCTTLLMEPYRTIEFRGASKKLCAPWRHHLRINPVTTANLAAVCAIAHMMFEYVTPDMHKDLFYTNTVTHSSVTLSAFTVVGYTHTQNMLSMSTEEFIQHCLARDTVGKRKVDELCNWCNQTDTGQYVGITKDFVNGLNYDFVFGVVCNVVPTELPAGVVTVKVLAGDYAVYNSSAGDYTSIWRHFTDRYYDETQKGYDVQRYPFEYYNVNGTFANVHIPVSAHLPKEGAKWVRPVFTPDAKVAGIASCCENDHPMYNPTPFTTEQAFQLFPFAERILSASIHAELGKPMLYISGVEIDHTTVVPEGLEMLDIRGGYWHLEGRRHFNGGSCGWPLHTPYESKARIHDLNHPRAFIEYKYRSRGGYSEIAVPIRIVGQREVEVVELPTTIIVGLLEAPPEHIVTSADLQRIYQMDINPEKGSITFAFTYARKGPQRDNWYFDQPIIKGVETSQVHAVPAGMQVFKVEGGQFMKVTETIPNGEYDWGGPWYAFNVMPKETGYEVDLNRQIIVRQTGYGKRFEAYFPIQKVAATKFTCSSS